MKVRLRYNFGPTRLAYIGMKCRIHQKKDELFSIQKFKAKKEKNIRGYYLSEAFIQNRQEWNDHCTDTFINTIVR